MREESHNLCFIFFKILANLHLITPFGLLQFGYSSDNGAVGSASAWQTRGRGFEHVLMRYTFRGNNSGSCFSRNVVEVAFPSRCGFLSLVM